MLIFYYKARYILGCPPINPCLYNGKCVDKPFGFACICTKAYYGNRCQFKRRRKTTTLSTTTSTTTSTRTKQLLSFQNTTTSDVTTPSSKQRNNATATTMWFSSISASSLPPSISFETRVAANSILGSNSCSKEFSCENRGVCLETTNGFQCQCLPQFTGVHCELRLN